MMFNEDYWARRQCCLRISMKSTLNPAFILHLTGVLLLILTTNSTPKIHQSVHILTRPQNFHFTFLHEPLMRWLHNWKNYIPVYCWEAQSLLWPAPSNRTFCNNGNALNLCCLFWPLVAAEHLKWGQCDWRTEILISFHFNINSCTCDSA